MSMKADDRILSATRKAKGCPFQGSSRVRQPWQDLKGSPALKTRLFGDRGFESVFLQRRVSCEPDHPDAGKAGINVMFEFTAAGERIRCPDLRRAARH